MTEIQIANREEQLCKIEKEYSNLMRRSFEVALTNREKAGNIHDKAEELFIKIIATREELNLN
jgi:hypothetical protein